MSKTMLLLRASLRRQRGSVFGVFVLALILSLCLFTAVTLYFSGEASVSPEMDRLGFGDITVWVSGNEDALKAETESLPFVSKATAQPLLFAGYEINGAYSDTEGQWLVYDGSIPYRFISETGEVVETPEISPGTVYISPALHASFDVSVGDTIRVELSRAGGDRELKVAGYFQDAFMGSSMIDMKSFLISRTDWDEMLATIESAVEYDVLGRRGAMLHLFKDRESTLSEAEFQRQLQTASSLSQYTLFSYNRASILSYMLLLQNIVAGFLLCFSLVLLIVCLIVLGHSLSATIQQGSRDMAILKTIGLTGGDIRVVYLMLYGAGVIAGLLLGSVLTRPAAEWVAARMVTSTGMRIVIQPPLGVLFLALGILLCFALFLLVRTARILRIAPMQIIRESAVGNLARSPIKKRWLCPALALREVLSAKRRYAGILLISLLLVVFLSVIGRMNSWLGTHGEGLMDAFSVAEHDLGVQPMNADIDMAEIERVIAGYSPIRETYELAMQSVTLNGQAYTANVLDNTSYFHLLEGNVCGENEILITHTVMNEMDLAIGDEVEIASGGRRMTYAVSGVYQCANGMGGNLGMSREGYARIANVNGFIWCRHYILEDGSVRDEAMAYLQEHYRGIDVHTNSWSGLAGIVAVMRLLIGFIYGVAALFIFVSVLLAAGKLLQSETGNMAVYQSLGLPASKLRLSFALRFFLIAALGAILGAVTSALMADGLIVRVFRLFGIGAFRYRPDTLGTLLPPLAVAALFFGFAWLCSGNVSRVSLVKYINENEE